MKINPGKNKQKLLMGLLLAVLVGSIMYPIARGNTYEEFTSINLVEIENPQSKQVRGMSYNEILVAYRYFWEIKAAVFNDIGYDLISEEDFANIDIEDVKNDFNAFAVIKNGPRFWTMDEIKGYYLGTERTIAGFTMNQPGILNLSIATLNRRNPYTVNTINRKTLYSFKQGEKVYEIINELGEVFTMQSGSREIDPNLTIEALDDLGSRLNLPAGWRYQVRILDRDVSYFVDGTAYLIQDEFRNSYQKNPL